MRGHDLALRSPPPTVQSSAASVSSRWSALRDDSASARGECLHEAVERRVWSETRITQPNARASRLATTESSACSSRLRIRKKFGSHGGRTGTWQTARLTAAYLGDAEPPGRDPRPRRGATAGACRRDYDAECLQPCVWRPANRRGTQARGVAVWGSTVSLLTRPLTACPERARDGRPDPSAFRHSPVPIAQNAEQNPTIPEPDATSGDEPVPAGTEIS